MTASKDWDDTLRWDWWNEDYSWDGLAAKPLKGFSVTADGQLVPSSSAASGLRAATLQDYWRSEEEHLISAGPQGLPLKRWTRVHLPEKFPHGLVTKKSSWSEQEWASVEQLVQQKVADAAQLAITSDADAIDVRAQLQGATVRALPAKRGEGLAINAQHVRCLARLDLSSVSFVRDTDFSNASFESDAAFTKASFHDAASFEHAWFAKSANFSGASFKASARFGGAAFSGTANFSSATIHDGQFFNSNFALDARFVAATFVMRGLFGNATLRKAAFDRCHFKDGVSFQDASFGSRDADQKTSSFVQARFSGNSDFRNASFESPVAFVGAAFENPERTTWRSLAKLPGLERTMDVLGVTFNSCRFMQLVIFDNSLFSTQATFESAVFNVATFCGVVCDGPISFAGADFAAADFGSATFAAQATFDQAVFRKAAFDGVRFRSRCSFERASFHDSTRLSFTSAEFSGETSFASAIWPSDVARQAGAFRDATFGRLVDITGAEFSAFALFDGARFGAEARYSVSTIEDDRAFRQALGGASDGDGSLRALEGGCRALKAAAEGSRDKLGEQTFYRFELTCRQRQHTTSPVERALLGAYELTSRSGTSVGRPVLWLLLLWLVSAACYWLAALFLRIPPVTGVTLRMWTPFHGSIFDALSLGAHVIFAPFDVWGDHFAASAFDKALIDRTGLGMRLLATLEAFPAVVLFFLSGLAIRRRFQIS